MKSWAFVLGCLLCSCTVWQPAAAQETEPQPAPGLGAAALDDLRTALQVPPAPHDAAMDEPGSAMAEPESGTPSDQRFDPALVSRGESSFQNYCVDCHDAARSLDKRKTFSAWLATTRRMAAKDDADIPESEHEAISTYLASVAGVPEAAAGDGAAATAVSGWNFSATVSTMYRTTNQEDLENPGFFADVWLTADWQSSGPLRASIITCTSCHADFNFSEGFTFELVEASAAVDLRALLTGESDPAEHRGHGHKGKGKGKCPGCEPPISAELKAGRFVVPFGAFSANPSVNRMVANPLMFDMGRRKNGLRYLPVLPAPYSDEGFDLNVGFNLGEDLRSTFDVFVVNGFQGDLNISMADTRSYDDNNREPGFGGRMTFRWGDVRFGGSVMGGQMQDDGSDPLWYLFAGADVVYSYEDLFRAYFEYALRDNQSGLPTGSNRVDGVVFESELRVWEDPRVGILFRYDTLDQKRYLIFPDSFISRYTYGVNLATVGGSNLLINHEIWDSSDFDTFSVVGFRWVATF